MVIRPRNKLAVCLMAAFWSMGLTAFAQSGSEQLSGPAFVPDEKFKGFYSRWMAQAGRGGLDRGPWRTAGQRCGRQWLAGARSLVPGYWVLCRVPLQGCLRYRVLLRMTKTADGMTGTYYSVKGGTVEADNLTLDATGNIVARQKLTGCRWRNFAMLRRCLTPRPIPSLCGRITPNQPLPGVTLPLTMPHAHVRVGEWNELEVMLDADIIRGYLNNTGRGVSAATDDDDLDSYGPIALYVGKGSEVRFKDVSYKDLAIKVQPLEQVGDRFRMQRVSPFYYNWTATDADFNHDGKLDLVSGAYLYYGPDFTKFREIYPARTFNPSTEYSTWVQHAYDVTGDGWADVVATDLGVGAVLYVNPGNESRRWKQYRIIPSMQSENSLLTDVDGDGKPELIYIADGYMRYAKPDPADPTAPWVVHTISEKGPWPAHGIGVGDINGDGRMDIVGAFGWWEQPASAAGQQLWKYHPEPFGRWGRIGPGGSTIGIYDVNGDGLNDVVTALEAHGFGLAWFEQKRAANGDISFVRHMVMDDYNTTERG